jgi:hypothetical protein
LISAIGSEYVKTGELAQEHGRALNLIEELREEVDYTICRSILREEVVSVNRQGNGLCWLCRADLCGRSYGRAMFLIAFLPVGAAQGISSCYRAGMSTMRRTVDFEERYGVSINGLKSTEEVDACVEKKAGVRLRVVAASSDMTDRAGNGLSVKRYDIDGLLDIALR